MRLSLIQLLIYSIIQAGIRYAYRDAPGQAVWIKPLENLQAHFDRPFATFLSVTAAVLVMAFVFHNWDRKPYLLRVSLAVLLPCSIVIYFFFGEAFEYRVFAEVYSTVAILAISR